MQFQTIGLIGAGLMGHGIGANLLKHGLSLVVMGHRNRVPIDDLVARGANEARSPAELAARVDAVILCVTSSAIVEPLMRGPDGLLAGARPGLFVIDCTTARPASTKALAAEAAARGVTFVDAPLTRAPKESEEGRLNVIVGGDEATVERIRPILQCFCENIFTSGGPVGSAHALKLVNNFLALGAAAMVVEAMATAERAGVDPRRLLEVASKGGADSYMLRAVIPQILEGDGPVSFAIRNAVKDFDYYIDLARTFSAETVAAPAIRALFARAVEEGLGDENVPEVKRVLDRR